MLRSLDLFTGIGGFALGLKGLCRPVAFCDLDPDAREVLRQRMAERKLDLSLVFDDVTALKATDLPLPVDLIVGGFPCQDLSAIGLRRGLGGARSGLVREIFRLMDETGARAAFLENVPRLLSPGNGFRDVLAAFVLERGFTVSWCVLPASAMGAPHIRRRLYMWICKPDFVHEWPASAFESAHYAPFEWSPQSEPTRMVPPDATTKDHRGKRQMMLGNAVVPDALRTAFFVLASGFRTPVCADAVRATSLYVQPPLESALIDVKVGEMPKWGHARRSTDNIGIEIFAVRMPDLPTPQRDFVLVPNAHVFEGTLQTPKNGAQRSPLVTAEMPIKAWSTPRSVTCAAHSLTKRVARDLPTQVRFEKNTPDALRDGQIRTEFVEWVMGYPEGWTRLPTHWKTTAPVGARPNGRGVLKRLVTEEEEEEEAEAAAAE